MKRALHQRWAALSVRERAFLLAGGLVGALSLLYAFAVDPLWDRLTTLDRQATRKARDLKELAALGAEFATLRERLIRLEERMPPGQSRFSLLSFLEETAARAGVRDRIAGMQPLAGSAVLGYPESAVELRLEDLQMPQLLGFLVKLEQSPYRLQVTRLQVRPRTEAPHFLAATVRVSAYAKD
jgi:general secretion pathway protein M